MQNAINLDGIEYVRADSFQSAPADLTGDFQPFDIGSTYLIRTVTMIDTGRVIAASKQWIVLEDAAWIADTGRFSNALKSCSFAEVEPYPDGRVIINAGSIIDAVKVKASPRSQK